YDISVGELYGQATVAAAAALITARARRARLRSAVRIPPGTIVPAVFALPSITGEVAAYAALRERLRAGPPRSRRPGTRAAPHRPPAGLGYGDGRRLPARGGRAPAGRPVPVRRPVRRVLRRAGDGPPGGSRGPAGRRRAADGPGHPPASADAVGQAVGSPG